MTNVYFCEYRVCGNYACRYVLASNQLQAVELIVSHHYTLSPLFKVTDINLRELEFISKDTINNLKNKLYGNT